MILLICLCLKSLPRPKSSIPQLFETTVKFLGLCFTKASIRFSGIPQSPKPPTIKVLPSIISLVAYGKLIDEVILLLQLKKRF